MVRLLILLCCFSVRVLFAQDGLVDVLEYEIKRWDPFSEQHLVRKLTVYRRGAEVYAFLDNMNDTSFVAPNSRFKTIFTWPYGGFYYDADSGQAVWVRVLRPGDTIRAELTYEPEAWELLPDTATISGFFCRKAKRHFGPAFLVEAWYTEDLGFTAMPKEYLGLPGVLVRSTQYPTYELRRVRLQAVAVESLKPQVGRLVKLKRLRAAKSRAEKLAVVLFGRQ